MTQPSLPPMSRTGLKKQVNRQQASLMFEQIRQRTYGLAKQRREAALSVYDNFPDDAKALEASIEVMSMVMLTPDVMQVAMTALDAAKLNGAHFRTQIFEAIKAAFQAAGYEVRN